MNNQLKMLSISYLVPTRVSIPCILAQAFNPHFVLLPLTWDGNESSSAKLETRLKLSQALDFKLELDSSSNST